MRKTISFSEFSSLIEKERRDNNDICTLISNILCCDGKYSDGYVEGCMEKLFKESFESHLLTIDELRYFYIILHERFLPYKYLRDDIISIINTMDPPILDHFTIIERKRWLDRLPETMVIYRGLASDYVDLQHPGICWSTNKEKAIAFCKSEGMLLTALCKKKEVKCFFQGTFEYEVVLPQDSVRVTRIDRVILESQTNN